MTEAATPPNRPEAAPLSSDELHGIDAYWRAANYQIVAAGQVKHAGQLELNLAVKAAQWKTTANDRRVISRKSADIPELESVILARGVATSANYDPLASIY